MYNYYVALFVCACPAILLYDTPYMARLLAGLSDAIHPDLFVNLQYVFVFHQLYQIIKSNQVGRQIAKYHPE